MKTQKKTFLMLVFFFMVACMSQVSATVIDTIYVIANTSTETHYICYNNINDSVMIHCPIGHTNIRWKDPSMQGINGPDSVFVTNSNDGHWMFYSDQLGTWKDIYVYLVSAPYEPASMVNDTSVCTTNFLIELNAENPASNYQWSTGATTVWYDATTPGTYTVTVTNTCGTGVYSKTISYNNPNAPHLGADQNICLGDSATLTGTISNANSYLWSTGETTPTINVENDGNYWVYAQDNNGCNGRDTIHVATMQTSSQEILLATINIDPLDLTYGNNMITWYVDPLLVGSIDSVYIYREMGTNNYVLVGVAAYTDGQWSDGVNSIVHAWKYKISLVGDPCGESIQSSSVQTIHSWVSEFAGNYTIQWDPYVVDTKSTVTWYKILSGNGLNTLTVRDSVSGTLTSVTLPNTTDSIFVVGAELNGSKSFSGLALSNKTPNPTVTGIHEAETIAYSIYPNPANEQLNISIGIEKFQVEVLTLLGQVLLTEHNVKTLNVSNLPQGTYILSVIVDGVKTNKMFTKN